MSFYKIATAMKRSLFPAACAAPQGPMPRQSDFIEQGRRRSCFRWVLPLLLLALPAVVQAQFTFTTNPDDTITITGYTGPGGDVVIPDTINGYPVTSIGDFAFEDCYSLTNVTIPASVTSFGLEAFFYCSHLTNVWISTNVTSIGQSAFGGCSSLTSVTIPYGVTNIGIGAFFRCDNLTSIAVETNNPVYSSMNGVLFDKSETMLIQCPGGKTGVCAIPASVISIGDAALNNCFRLAAITVDTNSLVYSDVDGVLFNKSQITLIVYPGGRAGSYTIPTSVISIGGAAFYDCLRLTNITIPASVTSIGDHAFESSGLTAVMIPNSVTNIGNYAFQLCWSLTNITISANVASIGFSALSDCTRLTAVYFLGNTLGLDGSSVFLRDNDAIVYYMPGTTGWGTTFGDRPCLLWNPQAVNAGVQSNQFGFTITGNYMSVVVEACTNPVNPIWSPLQTVLVAGGSIYFSDPQWTNSPARFYRLRSP